MELQSYRHDPPEALYSALAKKVKSYHKYYHMGENTSVSVEVAEELLESIQYTAAKAGSSIPLEAALDQGENALAQRLEDAKRLLQLVEAMDSSHSQWRWETFAALHRYLEHYDHLHFAHRTPQMLSYPLAVPVPEQLRGIDWAYFYIHCLWLEVQILEEFPIPWDLYPPDYWESPENVCEVPVLSALGHKLNGVWTAAAIQEATQALLEAHPLPDAAREYACAVIKNELPRILAAQAHYWLFQP